MNVKQVLVTAEAYPSPELCLANDFAHSALASSHAPPQQKADGLAVGVQLALVPPAPQHLGQLSQSHQPAQQHMKPSRHVQPHTNSKRGSGEG